MSGNSILRLEGSGLVTAAAEIDTGQGSEGGVYAPISVRELVRGHLGKARRVAAHPFLGLMASVSSDRSLRLWSAEHRSQISSTRLVERATSLCFHPDGSAIAVGNEHGKEMFWKYSCFSTAARMSNSLSSSGPIQRPACDHCDL